MTRYTSSTTFVCAVFVFCVAAECIFQVHVSLGMWWQDGEHILEDFDLFAPTSPKRAPRITESGDNLEEEETHDHDETVPILTPDIRRPKNVGTHSVRGNMEKAIRLLFSSQHEAERYLQEHPLSDFSFFVYNFQSTQWNLDRLSRCIEEKYKPENVSYVEFEQRNCDWSTTACTPSRQSPQPLAMDTLSTTDSSNATTPPPKNHYTARRLDRNSDTVLSHILSNYQGAERTNNPTASSLYIVPFASNGWYECLPWNRRSEEVSPVAMSKLNEELFPYLVYYHDSDANRHAPIPIDQKVRHLFFQSMEGFLHQLPHSLVATVNTPGRHGGDKHFIVPYVNMNPEYQPSRLQGREESDSPFLLNEAFFQAKNVALAAVLRNSGNETVSGQLVDQSDILLGDKLAGLPFHLEVLKKREVVNEGDIMALYRRSVFCLCLREGDSPNQKRFFDAILSGCIPVVMTYDWSSDDDEVFSTNQKSYFAAHVPIHTYLPFAKGSFENEPEMGIDYSELVVEVNATCGLKCLKPALENALQNPALLKEKQTALAKYARFFSYGLEDEQMIHIDAVIATLVHARHESIHKVPLLGQFDGTERRRRYHEMKKKKMSVGNPNGASQQITTIDQHLDEIVDLLLPDDQVSLYRSQHPLEAFKFFVYELSATNNWNHAANCVEDRFRGGDTWDTFVEKYCDWGDSVCTPIGHTAFSQYSSLRMNRNTDSVLSKLFSEYKGPLRTFDANEAALFVVPYSTNGWYECFGARKRAKQRTSLTGLTNGLFPELSHWRNETKHQHLFFQSTNGGLTDLPLSLVASVNTPYKPRGGEHFIIPYVNTNVGYQPRDLLSMTDSFFAAKNYSLAAIMAAKISGNGSTRMEFMNHSDTLVGSEIGGLPVSVILLTNHRKLPSEHDALALYRQSLFCPTFRGDSPNQKRFFDVVMSGCLPVAVTHYFSKPGGANTTVNVTSYFAPNVELSTYLPYARGSFSGWPDMGIDYSEFVVEIDAKCGLKCIKPTLERLLANPAALKKKQQALAKMAKLFSFGLEGNAFQNVDTVLTMLVHARHEARHRQTEPE